ncbi:MAG: porin, partial [Alistipes sp.]|nr:porin [Alistipes sp.]
MRMILPVLLLLGVIGAARAQQPDTQSATASVEELSAEVAALKAKTSTWDKVLAALPKISGYVQTGYEWSDNSSTFFIKRVRLNLAGAIAPKLDYRVQIEFASPKIVDAYLCYKPFDELNVQLGEYKLPFSIENTDYVPLRYE